MNSRFIILLTNIFLLFIRFIYLYNSRYNKNNNKNNAKKLDTNHINEGFADFISAGKEWTIKGCYSDREDRAIPNYRGDLTPEQCQAVAIENGDNIIGLQYGNGIGGGRAQCFTGPSTSQYDKYGTTSACYITNNQLGSGWANNV
jgi:hypothetical protein